MQPAPGRTGRLAGGAGVMRDAKDCMCPIGHALVAAGGAGGDRCHAQEPAP